MPNVILHLAYSPDGRYLAAGLGADKSIRVFRAADGAEVFRDENYGEGSYSVEFDRRGRLLSTCLDGYLRLYDRNFKLIAKQAAPGGKHPFFARFSPDGGQAAIPGVAWAVNLSADGRYAVAAFGDGTIRWYETTRGREVLALYVNPDGKCWVAWTAEGFYDASPGADSLIVYQLNQCVDREGRFVATSQLAEKFLRPDLIARRLSPDGDRLITEAVNRLGDVEQTLAGGLAPKVELLAVEATGVAGEFRLKIRVSDQGGGIGGRVVYKIDEVEVGGRGTDMPMAGGDRVFYSEALNVSSGEHRLSVQAPNARGVLSAAAQRTVTVKETGKPEALHILAVGVADYDDGDLKLKFAAADARDVGKALATGGQNLFPRGVKLKVLPDQQATLKNILQAFDELAKGFEAQDTFVLFLAGHGQTSQDGRYYFQPWEMNYKNDAALAAQALGEEKLREMMRRMPLQGLTLLDTCRAGAMVAAREVDDTATRGVEEKGAISRLMATSGRAIIAASLPRGQALEGVEGHGVFTYALLQALANDLGGDGKVSVDEVDVKVSRMVPKLTEERFHFKQNTLSELNNAHFPLARR